MKTFNKKNLIIGLIAVAVAVLATAGFLLWEKGRVDDNGQVVGENQNEQNQVQYGNICDDTNTIKGYEDKIKFLETDLKRLNSNLIEPIKKFSQESNDNWDIYRNEKFNFKVEYPNTWLAVSGEEYGSVVLFMEFDDQYSYSLDGKLNPGYYNKIYVDYWDDINDENLRNTEVGDNGEKYNNIDDFLSDSDATGIYKTGETIVGGEKAYILNIPGEMGSEGIMFEHNNGYYRIEFSESPIINENAKKQFLSTFRFLN